MVAALHKPRLMTRWALLTTVAESLFSGTAKDLMIASDLTGGGSSSSASLKLSSQSPKKSVWTAFFQQCAGDIIHHAIRKLQLGQKQETKVSARKASFLEGAGDLIHSEDTAEVNIGSSVGTIVEASRSGLDHSREAEQSNSNFHVEELMRLTGLSLLPENESPKQFHQRVSGALNTWILSQAGSAEAPRERKRRKLQARRKCLAQSLAPALATALHFLHYPEERLSLENYWLNFLDIIEKLKVRSSQDDETTTLLDSAQPLTQSKSPGCDNPEKATQEFFSRLTSKKALPPLRTCFNLVLHVAAKRNPSMFSIDDSRAMQLRAMAKELLAKPHGFLPAQKADAAENLNHVYATISAKRSVDFLSSPYLYLLFEGIYQNRVPGFSIFKHLLSGVTRACDTGSLQKRIAEMVKRCRNLWDYLSITMVLLCCAKLSDPATSGIDDSGEDISEIMIDLIRNSTKTSNQQDTERFGGCQKSPLANQRRVGVAALVRGSVARGITSPQRARKRKLSQPSPGDEIAKFL